MIAPREHSFFATAKKLKNGADFLLLCLKNVEPTTQGHVVLKLSFNLHEIFKCYYSRLVTAKNISDDFSFFRRKASLERFS